MADQAIRLVALGASNLYRDLPTLTAALAARSSTPIDVVAACGNGRAYGSWSQCVAIRALPGIIECGLWPALATKPAPPNHGLLMDIGNDLVYGARARDVVAWVTTCVERLQQAGTVNIALVLPPIEVVSALPRWRYHLAKALLFPSRQLDHHVLSARLDRVETELRMLADRHGLRLIEQDPGWFGIDPIHPRPPGRKALLAKLLAAWSKDQSDGGVSGQTVDPVVATTLEARLRWRPLVAAQAKILGRVRHQHQPVFQMENEATVACY